MASKWTISFLIESHNEGSFWNLTYKWIVNCFWRNETSESKRRSERRAGGIFWLRGWRITNEEERGWSEFGIGMPKRNAERLGICGISKLCVIFFFHQIHYIPHPWTYRPGASLIILHYQSDLLPPTPRFFFLDGLRAWLRLIFHTIPWDCLSLTGCLPTKYTLWRNCNCTPFSVMLLLIWKV